MEPRSSPIDPGDRDHRDHRDDRVSQDGAGGGGPTYENRRPAEGISSPTEHALWSFFKTAFLVILGLAALLFLINVAATHLTPLIPFRWEKALVGQKFLQIRHDPAGEAKEEALRALAARLAPALAMPEGMEVKVFYYPGSTVNAFATFGGNIIFFQGMLDLLDSEDEVAMVLAHEMSHIKHRDAAKGLVQALWLLVLSLGLQGGEGLVGNVTDLGVAGYSRAQEEAADLQAVRALGKLYGNISGATGFFRVLAEKLEYREIKDSDPNALPAIMSSHPDTLTRLKKAEAEAKRLGIPVVGVPTPLPPALRGL